MRKPKRQLVIEFPKPPEPKKEGSELAWIAAKIQQFVEEKKTVMK